LNKEKLLRELGCNFITFEAPTKPPTKIFNKFYWWRRFETHKPLSKHKSFEEKFNNGDFDYSPYAAQIQYEYQWMVDEIIKLRKNQKDNQNELENEIKKSYIGRINKLSLDFEKDEFNRLEYLKKNLRRFHKGTEDQVNDFIENYAQGTIMEIYNQYRKWLLTQNKLINAIFENF